MRLTAFRPHTNTDRSSLPALARRLTRGLAQCALLLGAAAAFAQEPTPVSVAQPQQAIPTDRLSLTGDLVAAQQSSLSARIAGLVKEMAVDVGDRVTAGELLLSLDPALEQQTLQQRQAAVTEAEARYQESERLVKEAERLTRDNFLPQTELALRQAALAAGSAQLDAARADLQVQQTRVSWHQLRAPFDGVISRKLTETGEWVTPGTPVLELVATDKIYLDVQVPQERYSQLSPDTEVQVLADTWPDHRVAGRISAVVPVSNAGSRTFQVRLLMENKEQQLLPGTSATATFAFTRQQQPALLIPRDAVLRSPDGGFSVFVIAESDGGLRAERRRLELGLHSDGQVEVIDGLQAEDRVVTRGNETLRHNQQVRVLNGEAVSVN